MAHAFNQDRVPVGELRPSQLLWAYGPGALIDLPNVSVVTVGTDEWDESQCFPIEEHRLLNAVKTVLGQQVNALRRPPLRDDQDFNPLSAQARIGVPVRPFPRYLRCIKCGLLSEFDAGLFKCKDNFYRPENTRFVHLGCRGSDGKKPPKDADAVPARFLLACRNGHLDDFPWRYFVHAGNSSCNGTLRFYESGASLQTENLWVKCDECGQSRSMAHAFGQTGKENLPKCRGRHPHLNKFDESCDEDARPVLLGATNSWFPIQLSALAIPILNNPLKQLVLDGWEDLKEVESIEQLKGILKVMIRRGILPSIEKYKPEEIWQCIEDIRSGKEEDEVTESDIKSPEWEILISENPPTDWPHFLSKKTDIPITYEKQIHKVLLLERLREVNALLGFTRVEAPEETADPNEKPPRAPLSQNRNPTWVPANEVHGEGIFIQFNEDVLSMWENDPKVIQHNQRLFLGHRGWRTRRRLSPDSNFPAFRYMMIHSLSHLLIRELALECGYNAASIRERIYAEKDEFKSQAGLLLYTAAADSDGTLGGLVELGKPENLGRLLDQALSRAKICSSDPLCAEHEPDKDSSLHVAACHACLFASETSCELQNRYLDRALVVPTLETSDVAFFDK